MVGSSHVLSEPAQVFYLICFQYVAETFCLSFHFTSVSAGFPGACMKRLPNFLVISVQCPQDVHKMFTVRPQNFLVTVPRWNVCLRSYFTSVSARFTRTFTSGFPNVCGASEDVHGLLT
uniref:Uncharacterized protein n=1 Tax=Ixodes ricinus TaxID=34613 RepID=A0A6B0UMV8_IXORI